MDSAKVVEIAKACHEANKKYCESIGDFSQLPWDEAPEWQRASAIRGVEFRIANLDAGPEEQHSSWVAEKISAGWVYGEDKNEAMKTHPCIKDYFSLPIEQRKKDEIFVETVKSFIEGEEPGNIN